MIVTTGDSTHLPIPNATVAARPVLDIDTLPPLPDVAWRILEMTSDLYLGVGELSDLVARDQALTARVLRIANSAFFLRGREIRTVRQAAIVLGNRKIRGIVIAASLGGVVQRTPLGKVLWEHALGVALAGCELAAATRRVDPEDAFVCGLLHDIGKVIFDLQQSQAFLESVAFAQANPDLCTLDSERAFLGWTHTEAGGLVAESWNLPEPARDVIANHHDPDRVSFNRDLTWVVSAADWMCHGLGIGPFRRPVKGPEECTAWTRLGQDPEALGSLADGFLTRMLQDKQLVGLG